MKPGQRLWTRDELILTINLYCKLPFGRLHKLNPEIIHLAKLINRTPSSVALKLGNFASLDSSLKARGIKGASNASNLDKEVWNEFFQDWNNLAFESEKLLAQSENISLEALHHMDESGLPKEGKERERTVKTRVNQAFFRSTVLAAYNQSCCITGINQPELLIAGHIRPWGLDVANRLNPRNGLALNALHDKAFEVGYITITPEYVLKVSPALLKQKQPFITEYFGRYNNQPILLPSRFLPDPEFLKYHNHERFKG